MTLILIILFIIVWIFLLWRQQSGKNHQVCAIFILHSSSFYINIQSVISRDIPSGRRRTFEMWEGALVLLLGDCLQFTWWATVTGWSRHHRHFVPGGCGQVFKGNRCRHFQSYCDKSYAVSGEMQYVAIRCWNPSCIYPGWRRGHSIQKGIPFTATEAAGRHKEATLRLSFL